MSYHFSLCFRNWIHLLPVQSPAVSTINPALQLQVPLPPVPAHTAFAGHLALSLVQSICVASALTKERKEKPLSKQVHAMSIHFNTTLYMKIGVCRDIYIFRIVALNISCESLLETPPWGGFNKHPQSMFLLKKGKVTQIFKKMQKFCLEPRKF